MEPNYSLLVLFMAYMSYSDANIDSKVERVLNSFDFQGESSLLQFWKCSPLGDSDDIGSSLALTTHFRVSNIHDSQIIDYRTRCFLNNPLIGRETNVGNWFAGRAAQTGVADHRTNHVLPNQDNQYIDEALRMGQLVVPVYFNHPVAGMTLAGIIELVTTQPKESYVEDFDRIHNSLMMVNLTSTYLGKMIKVEYNHHMIKFTLPFSAELPDLQMQVTMRFKELENKTFCILYENTNGERHSVLNDLDLKFCLDESISRRMTIIRMYVHEQVLG